MALTDAQKKKLVVSQYHLEKLMAKINADFVKNATDDSTKTIGGNVDISTYESAGSSFYYMDGYTYTYGTRLTTEKDYLTDDDDETPMRIFKVVDEDKYLAFELSVDNAGVITLEYSASYTTETLPDEARAIFEVSSYAITHHIVPVRTDSIDVSKVNCITDPSGREISVINYYVDTAGTGLFATAGRFLIMVNIDYSIVYVYKWSAGQIYKYYGYYSTTSSVTITKNLALKLRTYAIGNLYFDKTVDFPQGTLGYAVAHASESAGTTYTAGDGIVISGTTLSVNTSTSDEVNNNINY